MKLKYRIILPSDIEVVIASGGGVGSTFVWSFLSQFKKANKRDENGFKHSPLPPLSWSPQTRFVFIHGDPLAATGSLFRRGIQRKQSRKLLRWTHPRMDPIPGGMTIDEYAAEGVDRFLWHKQFENWYERHLNQPTLFLRYETVFENVEPLLDFLDLPASLAKEFPEKRKRNTSVNSLLPETVSNLKAMYRPYYQLTNQVADAEIRTPQNRWASLFSVNGLDYVRPLKDHFLK